MSEPIRDLNAKRKPGRQPKPDRTEKIDQILSNMQCGNNDTPMSKMRRKNLKKMSEEQFQVYVDTFITNRNKGTK